MPRTKKDPNKPKGKMSAYLFFMQSEREAMRLRSKQNGHEDNLSFSELSKFCSEKWKCLDEAKKAPFFKSAEDDKARFEQEMSLYTQSEDESTPKKSRKRKRQNDENLPKRNKSAYMFFCDDERPKTRKAQPELTMKEILQVLGKKWRKLESKEKDVYNKMADEDKQRYAKEMSDYKKSEIAYDGMANVKKQK